MAIVLCDYYQRLIYSGPFLWTSLISYFIQWAQWRCLVWLSHTLADCKCHMPTKELCVCSASQLSPPDSSWWNPLLCTLQASNLPIVCRSSFALSKPQSQLIVCRSSFALSEPQARLTVCQFSFALSEPQSQLRVSSTPSFCMSHNVKSHERITLLPYSTFRSPSGEEEKLGGGSYIGGGSYTVGGNYTGGGATLGDTQVGELWWYLTVINHPWSP